MKECNTNTHTRTHTQELVFYYNLLLLTLLVSFKCQLSKESLIILMIIINFINLYDQYLLNYQLKLSIKLSVCIKLILSSILIMLLLSILLLIYYLLEDRKVQT